MSFSQALEVVIGLIFVYYVLGSIVSLITQWINEAFETRGRSLEKHLMRIVGDKQVGDFVKLPQLQSLRPIRYKNWMSVFTSATEPKKLEKIPVATLVDSYFDFVGLTATREVNAEGLKNLLNTLPDTETKRAVIQWIDQGVTDIKELQKRTTTYFAGVMDQAAATFKANARSFVIVLSIFLTLLLGTDSIELARTLWTNASVRALAVAQAEAVAQQEGGEAKIDDLIEQLSALNIVRIGWWQMEAPDGNWGGFIALKVLGLSLTAAAVSQGSSFWYDLLKKVVSPSKGGGGGGGDSGEAKG
ncbi:MAG: hypothetical protein DPW18_12675 [Chloroflexi bacterium]|nr:hypothetical protein [Chloroflexota bacterium]MDL1941891.1 hypothetical protein [Chloroflexi bacterium CFX2]